MSNTLARQTINVTRTRTPTNSFELLIFFALLIIGIIITIKVIDSEFRKDDAQFDETHNQSENFRLLNSIMLESIKYYRINRIKNAIIFGVAIIACFFGLYITAFHTNLLDLIFGTITEFISATFFWIYKQCQKEERYYYDKLFYLKKVLIAIALNNSEKNKSKKINDEKIIDILIDHN